MQKRKAGLENFEAELGAAAFDAFSSLGDAVGINDGNEGEVSDDDVEIPAADGVDDVEAVAEGDVAIKEFWAEG